MMHASKEWRDMIARQRLTLRVAERFPSARIDVLNNYYVVTAEQYVVTRDGVEVGYLPYSIKIPKEGDPVDKFVCVVHYKGISNSIRHWAQVAGFNAEYFEDSLILTIGNIWKEVRP